MYKIPANTLFTGQNLIYVPECHSTNSLLSQLNNKSPLAEGTIVITDNQTAGRGQRGNTWEAQPGMNVTFSLLLRPTFLQAAGQFQLNIALSLAVAEALQFSLEQPIKLKWPNDILVGDKKIGGILIENQLLGTSIASSIAGIGININQENFSHHKATSLFRLTGTTFLLNDIFQRLMKSIELAYLSLRAGKAAIQKEHYLHALYKFNELHSFEAKGSEFYGLITDITESGKLCIESNGKTREFSLQEVRFLG